MLDIPLVCSAVSTEIVRTLYTLYTPYLYRTHSLNVRFQQEEKGCEEKAKEERRKKREERRRRFLFPCTCLPSCLFPFILISKRQVLLFMLISMPSLSSTTKGFNSNTNPNTDRSRSRIVLSVSLQEQEPA